MFTPVYAGGVLRVPGTCADLGPDAIAASADNRSLCPRILHGWLVSLYNQLRMPASPAPSTTAASADTIAVANKLRPVLLHLNRHLRREAQSQGTSASQISLLAGIEGNPGIGIADLASREGMAAPSVCTAIDRLQAAGYVTRIRENTGDRRRVGLAVTADGTALLRRVRSRRTAWLASRLQALTPDELARIHDAVGALSALVTQR